jgi:hypothetical protein
MQRQLSGFENISVGNSRRKGLNAVSALQISHFAASFTTCKNKTASFGD